MCFGLGARSNSLVYYMARRVLELDYCWEPSFAVLSRRFSPILSRILRLEIRVKAEIRYGRAEVERSRRRGREKRDGESFLVIQTMLEFGR